MSCAITETQEMELVNIISISQNKLVRNFEILSRQLKSANERISFLESRFHQHSQDSSGQIELLRSQGHQVQHKLLDIVTQIGVISGHLTSISTEVSVKSGQQNMKIVDIQLNTKQLCNKIDAVDKTVSAQIQGISVEQAKINQIVNVGSDKQSYNFQRLEKEIDLLVIKSESSGKKYRFCDERLETLERQINGEETVKLQDIIIQKVVRQLKKNSVIASRRDIGKPVPKEGKPESKEGKPESKAQIEYEVNASQKQIQVRLDLKKVVKSKGQVGNSRSSGMVQQGQVEYFIDDDYTDMSEIRSIVQKMKTKIKHLEISSSEPLGALLDAFKKDINEIKTHNEDIKKEVVKLKTDLSSTNFGQKLQELRPQLNKIWGVISNTEDKNVFLERKLQEMKKTMTDVSNYVKQNNTSRYDEKIKMLQSDFFNQLKELSMKLQLKTNSSDFFKHCHDSSQQLKDIKTSLANKCQKVEVKKALLFIESKIKEIILVISEDQEYERDALLTKKTIKCISCDKQLDKQNGAVNMEGRNWNMMPQKQMHPEIYGKCGISRFGSLASKIKKLEGSQLPILKSKAKDKEKQNKEQD